MSKVKYKAVEGECEFCVNKPKLEDCSDFVAEMIKLGLPDCCEVGCIYIQKPLTVTLEQAREKFESHYGYQEAVRKNEDGTYCELTTDLQWEGYLQALKDFNILEEGE